MKRLSFPFALLLLPPQWQNCSSTNRKTICLLTLVFSANLNKCSFLNYLVVLLFIQFSMNFLGFFQPVVGSSGLEPPTSRLSGARSNLLSYEPICQRRSVPNYFATGGDDGIRTHDPLLAGQVLSQLSYTPLFRVFQQSLKIEQ